MISFPIIEIILILLAIATVVVAVIWPKQVFVVLPLAISRTIGGRILGVILFPITLALLLSAGVIRLYNYFNSGRKNGKSGNKLLSKSPKI
jgi:hypothetical protein